jgi:hypothetical protein
VKKPHKKKHSENQTVIIRFQDFRMAEKVIYTESNTYPRYDTAENELKRNLIMETSKREVEHHRTVKPRKVAEVKEITAVEDEVSFFQDFVAGGIAGSASVIVGHPFDTIKVCM